ncbi:MAG: hypothetical protein WBC33_04030 [Conexibacter sp.]
MARSRVLTATLAICAALAFDPSGAARAAPSTPADDLALARQFRPRLLFDAKERWRPTDVDRFLAEAGHQACSPGPVPPAACTPLTSVAQLTPDIDHLDLRGTRADGADATDPDLATCAKSLPDLRDCDADGRSVIYAHIVRGRTTVAIDYWWFLRYNAYSFDRHEGDWEGVTVIVDAADTRVVEVHFAAHAGVWRYEADVSSIVEGRVKVFVARGSHASYPRRCARFCRQTGGTLPEAHFGGERSWIGNSAAGCRRRCVRLLPESGGAPTSWDAWKGRWGITRAKVFPPPLTPAFQSRFAHPFTARHSGRHQF